MTRAQASWASSLYHRRWDVTLWYSHRPPGCLSTVPGPAYAYWEHPGTVVYLEMACLNRAQEDDLSHQECSDGSNGISRSENATETIAKCVLTV
jgi:hypothetical protein